MVEEASRSISAPRWRRAVTYVVDIVAMIVIAGILLVAAMATGLQGLEDEDIAWLNGPLGTLACIVFPLVYYFATEALMGRTLGKMVARTRVVDADGRKPSLSVVLIRTLIRLLPFEWVGIFLAERRALHDSWSDTFVVHVQKPAN